MVIFTVVLTADQFSILQGALEQEGAAYEQLFCCISNKLAA